MRADLERALNDRSALLAVMDKLASASDNPSALANLVGSERALINHWASRANLDLEFLNQKGVGRIQNLASESYTRIVLDASSLESRSYNSQVGIRSISSYNLEINDGLKSQLATLCLSRSRILDTMRNSDAYQHLVDPGQLNSQVPFISLFVFLINRQEANNGAPAHWCFVAAQRDENSMKAFFAVHVFQQDIILDAKSASPLDLLKSFLDIYGFDIIVSGINRGKLLGYCILEGRDSYLEFGKGFSPFLAYSMLRRNPNGTSEVSMVFCLDTKKYTDSMGQRK